MTDRTRRHLLSTAGAFALAAMAGCASRVDPSPTETPDRTEPRSDALTDWERSSDCGPMHDTVISVEETGDDSVADVTPITFADLSSEERSILGTVTEEGGYATCDPGDALHRFLDRVTAAIDEHDSRRVALERDGTYYGLYVEFGDEVYSY